MSKAGVFFAFIIGAAVGVAVTWQYTKQKYEQIAQEEIDSVKRAFAPKRNDEGEDVKIKAARAKEKPDILEYAAKLQQSGYVNYSDGEKPMKEEEKEPMDKPYVISPDEFGVFEEYETVGLTYYNDQVLADDNDELVEELEETVGFDSLTRFGEYEDDSVFVRNDRLKCDFEILLDHRNYSDVLKKKPGHMEEQ